MQVDLHSAASGASARTRIILLPAAYQATGDLVAEGFIDAVRSRKLPVDIVIVDLNPLHLADRSFLARLHAECIAPARDSGCVSVWLAGISLGGYLALLYAAAFPGNVAGLCLLAPYLGNRMITAEISGYDSVERWELSTRMITDMLDEERRLWRFVARKDSRPMQWYLGFGRQDRYVSAHRLLASQLTAVVVSEIEGAHEWRVWRQLWCNFLDQFATQLTDCP